jgi:hypothetical protein
LTHSFPLIILDRLQQQTVTKGILYLYFFIFHCLALVCYLKYHHVEKQQLHKSLTSLGIQLARWNDFTGTAKLYYHERASNAD